MATRLKEVDAVMVGMGWTGSIMARELTKAGLTVVGLERGEDMHAAREFRPAQHPRRAQIHAPPGAGAGSGAGDGHVPQSRRRRPRCRCAAWARSCRAIASAAPPIIGAGCTGAICRADHLCRSHIVNRYGAKVIPEDMTIQDWAMTYDELEPYYDRFEKLCGVSGKAGNLRGQKIDGRQCFRRAAQQRISQSAAEDDLVRPDVREGGEGARLSSVSAADQQFQPGLYQ